MRDPERNLRVFKSYHCQYRITVSSVVYCRKTKEEGKHMALIKCPECGKEISDKAGNCPNCGYPIQTDQKTEETSPPPVNAVPQGTQETKPQKPKKKGGFLKILLIIVAVIVVIGVIGSIGGNSSGNDKKESNASSETKTEEKVYLTEEEIPQMFSDPDQFKGKYVKLSGQVFLEPEDTGDYIGLQVYSNPESFDNNFLVKAPKDGTEYTNDSYVVVDGKIEGTITGENLVGGTVSAPLIDADTVEISNYKDVVRPTIKEYTFESLSADQYGYSVSVTKVEFAEQETRVYATVKNNGGSKFSIFGYSAKLIQNGQQYETEMNFYADYPDLQSEVLPGTESSGVLVFPAIDADTDFQFYAEGYSENWEEDIQPYQLNAVIQN